MQSKRRAKVVKIPVAKQRPTRQPIQQTTTKRLILTVPIDLHEQLEALASEERRDLKDQALSSWSARSRPQVGRRTPGNEKSR